MYNYRMLFLVVAVLYITEVYAYGNEWGQNIKNTVRTPLCMIIMILSPENLKFFIKSKKVDDADIKYDIMKRHKS